MEIQLVSGLAAAAVSLLVSFLSKAGEAGSQQAGQDIYRQLKQRFSRRPGVQEALTDLQERPADADIQAAVRLQLRKLIAEDQVFRTELQRIVQISTDIGSVAIDQKAGNDSAQIGQVFGNVNLSGTSEKDPYEDMREFHEGGPLARLLMILGTVLIVLAFIMFLGEMVFLSLDFPSHMSSGPPLPIVLAFPVFFLGMVIGAIGSGMARNNVYKRRRSH